MSAQKAVYAAIVKMHDRGVDCGDLLGSEVLAAELSDALADDQPNAAIEALTWLVALKDGPRDAVYEEQKPKAWQAAREVLAATKPKPEPVRLTDDLMLDMLTLVTFPGTVTAEDVKGWTMDTRQKVVEWVSAVHLSASDNEGIEIPEMPEVLR